ncbi:NADPH:quinone reductase [Gracilibacillus ureilyticus]|uniref:NADPH:quinone reductase n=1 Tax=Gracilibacillus ureilyticus TaxID=531814 RepID=A0A1H9T9M8_9BACI|nr:zinc-binding alcohol dehydrogenase family protein [Gracilibacillus ureilyticus]SER93634.1 NADPH:quinone reductase [Gracilibacillus ureilyticus]
MKAVVLEKACSAEELVVRNVPLPCVKPGWVLVKIKAFGINRSEIFTRQGDSPSVKLPRIIGIECVGEILDPSDSDFQTGQHIVSLMGGLGRDFDGSYAEYTLIPANQVYSIEHDIDWITLAAIPEMYYTAYASLFETLKVTADETLLIRGGTSSVGLAALQLAKSVGLTVFSTTRDEKKISLLQHYGADHVLLEDGTLREQVLSIMPNGVNNVLELVGTATLKNSLQLVAEHGKVCMTGILSGEWVMDHFEPMIDIPTNTYLTQFTSTFIKKDLLNDLFDHILKHDIHVPIAKVFKLDEIGEAHRLMESNQANGKIVVTNE